MQFTKKKKKISLLGGSTTATYSNTFKNNAKSGTTLQLTLLHIE